MVRSTSRINSLHHSFIPTPFGRETHAGIALLLKEVQARWGIALRLVYMKVDGLVLLRDRLGFYAKTSLVKLIKSYPVVKKKTGLLELNFNFKNASVDQTWFKSFSLRRGSFWCDPVQMIYSSLNTPLSRSHVRIHPLSWISRKY